MKISGFPAILDYLRENADRATFLLIRQFIFKYIAFSILGLTFPSRFTLRKQISRSKHKFRYIVTVRVLFFIKREIVVYEYVGGKDGKRKSKQ